MKTISMAAAALAALIAVLPVQGATAGELPQSFNDQGTQVPAFPNGRVAPTTPAQAKDTGVSERLPVSFNDQGVQTQAFPSGTAEGQALRVCLLDSRKSGSC